MNNQNTVSHFVDHGSTNNVNNLKFFKLRKVILSIGIFYSIFFNYNNLFVGSNFLDGKLNLVLIFLFPMILFIVSMLFDGISIYEIIFFLLLFSICIIIGINLGSGSGFLGTFIPIPMYFFALRKIHPMDIMVSFERGICAALILTIFTYFMVDGIQVVIQDRGLTKQSLGFTLPNVLGTVSFSLISINLTKLFLNKNKKNNIIILLFLFFLLFKSGAISAWIATVTALVIALVVHSIYNKKILNIIGVLSIIFSLSVTLWFTSSTILSTSSFSNRLNEILNGRIFFSYYYMLLTPIKMFGQAINNVGAYQLGYSIRVNLDSNYLYWLLKYGVLFSILFIIYLVLLVTKSVNKDMPYLLIPIISFIIYGIVEAGQGLYYFNFTLLFSSLIFMNGNYVANRIEEIK
ncbi:hypothetical protein [Pseudolactococcus carnosus]|uniref:hypothetical protein n=1 Tax=Pseudolactococcus carnosus TaxID=2749961 RepID=UPI001FBB9C34|nr:hypothetical protein [Lactococcus carnosus]MCJ1968893.1 hypothetical protein [Lactococcus carnosus]